MKPTTFRNFLAGCARSLGMIVTLSRKHCLSLQPQKKTQRVMVKQSTSVMYLFLKILIFHCHLNVQAFIYLGSFTSKDIMELNFGHPYIPRNRRNPYWHDHQARPLTFTCTMLLLTKFLLRKFQNGLIKFWFKIPGKWVTSKIPKWRAPNSTI